MRLVPLTYVLIFTSLPVSVCRSGPRHPDFTVGPLTLAHCWERAEFAFIGTITDIKLIGKQVMRDPVPPLQRAGIVSWCEGDLLVTKTIKGDLHSTRNRFLWGTLTSGCRSPSENVTAGQAVTNIWLTRKENGYLRPVVDAGGVTVIQLFIPWERRPGLSTSETLAFYLLSPQALGIDKGAFAQSFVTFAPAACAIEGLQRCIEDISDLARDPELREAACAYLKSQFNIHCTKMQ